MTREPEIVPIAPGELRLAPSGRDAFVPDDTLEAAATTTWRREREAHDAARHDGAVACLVDYATTSDNAALVLETGTRRYRHILAGLRDPALRPHIRGIPLAVTGLLRADTGVVQCRRGTGVSQDPGLWECAPAGSLEAPTAPEAVPDPRRQLLAELEEELGLSRADIRAAMPLALLIDREAWVCDIVYHLTARVTFTEITAGFPRRSATDETAAIRLRDPNAPSGGDEARATPWLLDILARFDGTVTAG